MSAGRQRAAPWGRTATGGVARRTIACELRLGGERGAIDDERGHVRVDAQLAVGELAHDAGEVAQGDGRVLVRELPQGGLLRVLDPERAQGDAELGLAELAVLIEVVVAEGAEVADELRELGQVERARHVGIPRVEDRARLRLCRLQFETLENLMQLALVNRPVAVRVEGRVQLQVAHEHCKLVQLDRTALIGVVPTEYVGRLERPCTQPEPAQRVA